MAQTATMFRFELNLSDVDRNIYDTIELRVAQHPSETDEYLITRVLARALEHREGLSFGRGVCQPDDPPLSAPNEMGGIALWIEIGQPAADRLHKVTKQADEVFVYTHKSPDLLMDELAAGEVHRGDEIEVVSFAPDFMAELAALLRRTNRWEILRNEGVLYVTVDDETVQTTPGRARAADSTASK